GVVDSVEVFGEQRGRQVALTEVGEDDDDALAGVLLTRGDGLGGRECGTGGDAHEQALLLRDLTGAVEGGVVVDGDDLVVDLGVEDLGHEVRAETLNRVRSVLALAQDYRWGGLERDELY